MMSASSAGPAVSPGRRGGEGRGDEDVFVGQSTSDLGLGQQDDEAGADVRHGREIGEIVLAGEACNANKDGGAGVFEQEFEFVAAGPGAEGNDGCAGEHGTEARFDPLKAVVHQHGDAMAATHAIVA